MIPLLMTRPEPAARRFVVELLAVLPLSLAGTLRPVYAPLMRIDPLPVADLPGDPGGVIFTSANGVACAGIDAGPPAYCVGARTAAAARAAGWDVRLTCPDAAALVTALADLRPAGALLHLGGVHQRGDIATRLSAAGLPTTARAVYDQTLLPLDEAAQALLDGPDPVIVPLFSPRTARHFADNYGGSAPLYLGAISPAVAKSIENLPFAALEVAETPDSGGMFAVVDRLIGRLCRVEGASGAQ